jgi:hypothetical protein
MQRYVDQLTGVTRASSDAEAGSLQASFLSPRSARYALEAR